MRARDVIEAFGEVADAERARHAAGYFKTGKGEYGEGDVFLGATARQVYEVVRRYRDLPVSQVRVLLRSAIHEHRIGALLILVSQFERGDEVVRGRIYRFYMDHLHRVNNWDLVDCSAHKIVGRHLREGKRSTRVLDRLARSRDLWRRRVAMIATHAYIREREYEVPLRIAGVLLNDPHDLIHKAVGWMLREVGKRDRAVMEGFLRRHYSTMPRTMLRYAIERLPEKRRNAYLKGTVR